MTLGLWALGYRRLTAFDFAAELLDQAHSLAAERGAEDLVFLQADATGPGLCQLLGPKPAESGPGGFDGALFMFNGLMQIPGRERRRQALRELREACRPGAPLIFTTHDRDHSPVECALWRLEALRWNRGAQDPRLIEFGDRYFEDASGRTFMHLPDRAEILAELATTGWQHVYDAMRRDITAESKAVLDFADECRFWVARRD